jgi:hypothetical protein
MYHHTTKYVFAWEPIQDFLLAEIIINVGAGQVTVGCLVTNAQFI